jgi:hypothetical protein
LEEPQRDTTLSGGRPESTLSGHSGSRLWTSQLGGERAYRCRLGKDRGVRAIAAIPLRARNRLHRPKRKTLPRIEAAFAQIATAHSSGIPALRRPSYDRSLISTKRGSAPCFAARDIRCAFHTAIVLNDAVEGAR